MVLLKKIHIAVRFFIFFIIIVCLFCIFQKFFIPMWNYNDDFYGVDDEITEFKELPKDCLQVLFLGTSHVDCAISPLELYRSKGIISYNLGTQNQDLDESLLLLKEVYKTQHPKIVFLDVSKIFGSTYGENKNKIRDNISLDKNKISYVLAKGNGKSLKYNLRNLPERWGYLVPFWEYHSRWKEITEANIKKYNKKTFYRMGYNILSTQVAFGAWASGWIQANDDVAIEMQNRNVIKTFSYTNGVYNEKEDLSKPLYAPSICEEVFQYINAMKHICEEFGSDFILIKIPSKNLPQFYYPTWTKIKHDITLDFAKNMELKFLDFEYDIDCKINWLTDTHDGGGHLNYLGASKVSDIIGNWIIENNNISFNSNIPFLEIKIPFYDLLVSVCELQLTNNFSSYISKIFSNNNYVIFFSDSSSSLRFLNNSEKLWLKSLGFESDFNKINNEDSFIAIVEDGIVTYESISNREQTYSYKIGKENIEIISAGWLCGDNSSIKINGNEYIVGSGLNIVVYDKSANMVIDSISIDFNNNSERSVNRNAYITGKRCIEYQNYISEHPEVIK